MASSTPPKNPLLTLSAISLFTEDVAASKAFYTKVFGAAPLFEDAESCSVKFNNVILNLLVVSAADDLVKPSPVATAAVGKRFQLTVWVDDLEASIKKLKESGVTFMNGPETKPWGMRVVTFEDPAGHSWEIAQKV